MSQIKKQRNRKSVLETLQRSDDEQDDDQKREDPPGVRSESSEHSSSSSESDNESQEEDVPQRAARTRTAQLRQRLAAARQRRQSTQKQRRNKNDSDDSYHLEEDEESTLSSSSSDQDDFVEEESDKDARNGRSSSNRVGIVQDDEAIGVADDSSEDGNVAVSSPQKKKKRLSLDDLSFSSSSSSQDDDEPTSSPLSQHCPSERDAITDEPLPDTHICFVVPDGSARQCFSLDTLRRVALTKTQTRVTASGRTVQTFLQPPHFRTPLSDELLDQIATKFGRDAVDVNGEYYYRKKLPDSAVPEMDRPAQRHGAFQESRDFVDQLESYMRTCMGSTDVYCCPVCYIVAHKGFVGTSDTDDDDNEYVTDFTADPISVLGHLDNDFRIASTFCYRKVSALKQHLRKDHGLDTRIVEGNEAYTRYKIRVQDGLLQRYLGVIGTSRQGDMMRYWLGGNNSDFLLLLSLMGHANVCREIVENAGSDQEEEDVEAAQEYLQPALDFFESFGSECRDIWELFASPFRKGAGKEDIRGFLAGDEEEEEEDAAVSHQAMHMQATLEDFQENRRRDEALVDRYKRMAEGEESDDAEDEVDQPSIEFIELSSGSSEEDYDDFPTTSSKKRPPRRRLSKSPRKAPRPRVSLSADRALERDDESDNDSPVAPGSHNRKRRVIRDSDDEE